MRTFAANRIAGARLAPRARRGVYGSRLVGPLAARLRPRACVLVYHRIGRPRFDPSGQAVAAERFSGHLRAVSDGYAVTSVERLLENLSDGTLADGTVAITFDDGYADTLTDAAPIAASRSVPLHVFVTVRPLLEPGPFWWDELALAMLGRDGGIESDYAALHAELKRLPEAERSRRLRAIAASSQGSADVTAVGRPLTVSELRALAALPGVTIGAHSLSHASLAALGPDDQRRELRDARGELERLLGRPVTTASYPFGKHADLRPETPGLAAEAGYEAAFTSAARPLTPRSPRFALPRLTAHDWPEDELRARLRSFFGY